MGNSGTAMRLFTGLLAGQRFDSELIGDASLMRRPMERVAIPLRQMGAAIETQSGLPPVRIAGGRHLHAIQYHLPMASAQVKSAILLAGIYAQGTTSITEPAITRDHSERMLQAFGVNVHAQGQKASTCKAPHVCADAGSTCRAISHPRHSLLWPAVWRRMECSRCAM